jgi:hypothetical protein
MPQYSRELFTESMALMDAVYDPVLHLEGNPETPGLRATVRSSSWYALGLLMRGRSEDVERASAVLSAVLDQQYLDPNTKWYGTFKRNTDDAVPQAGAHDFTSFDPNWRQFICTIFEMILIEYPDSIPAALRDRMYSSIDVAIQGEIQEGRLVPSYTNISLMYGSMWDFAAQHDRNASWRKQSVAWMDATYALFHKYRTFNEYNAPTYYGVDLYGLALWREYGSTAKMRSEGRTMEAGLWNDIALFYQPELRNICGPYDRTYGMDMSVYVTPTGVWMRTLLAPDKAPLPEAPTRATFQVGDMEFAPQIVLLGTRIPPAALAKIRKFTGPHMVTRRIDEQRVATAWIGHTAMWGGEAASLTKDSGHATQFHPVDAQWRMPSGEIGWITMTRSPKIDALADMGGVTITTDGDVTIRVFTGKSEGQVSQSNWTLPGLRVMVKGDATGFSKNNPADCTGCVDATYRGVKTMRLEISVVDAPR